MAGTFGGYGLPLQGQLPAELTGTRRYALGEENTLAPASPGEEVVPEEVVRDTTLVKAISLAALLAWRRASQRLAVRALGRRAV